MKLFHVTYNDSFGNDRGDLIRAESSEEAQSFLPHPVSDLEIVEVTANGIACVLFSYDEGERYPDSRQDVD
jgi:hypothetical protein